MGLGAGACVREPRGVTCHLCPNVTSHGSRVPVRLGSHPALSAHPFLPSGAQSCWELNVLTEVSVTSERLSEVTSSFASSAPLPPVEVVYKIPKLTLQCIRGAVE